MDNTTKVKEVTTSKEVKSITIDIVCVDCKATRTIAKQEAFQVKRCVTCQEKHKKEQRKGYRKNRIATLKADLESALNALAIAEEELAKLRKA